MDYEKYKHIWEEPAYIKMIKNVPETHVLAEVRLWAGIIIAVITIMQIVTMEMLTAAVIITIAQWITIIAIKNKGTIMNIPEV